jgi:WD40 repeat protein
VNARFHPGGNVLATIGKNGRVALWDTATYEAPSVLPAMDKRTFSLAYSPDGRWLAFGGAGTVHLYDVEAGAVARTLEGHQHAVGSLAFTGDGERLVATGAEGAVSVWEVGAWTLGRRIDLPSRGYLSLALAHDDETAYVSMDRRIQGYAMRSGELTLDIPVSLKGVYGLAVSPDGKWLANAAADGNVRVWEL